MPDYTVNDDAVEHARKLIEDGQVDTGTEWSDAAPSTDDENEKIDADGYDAFGLWHLGLEEGASEGTKGRYGFPYGDFAKVNRAALVHAKQRASQNGHDALADAAGELLDRVDGGSS